MSYTEICNQPWMFIFVGVILLAVIAQNAITMRKAWNHAKNDLGIPPEQIRKGLTNGIIVSIAPTIPVIIVLLSLIPLLGTPLPWLRLSVIGSATFESIAASIGVESAGEVLQVGGYTVAGWIAACWCMGIGGSSSVLWSLIAIKPIEKLFGAAEKFNFKLVLTIGTGCLMGIMAYAAISFGLVDIPGKFKVWFSSFLLGTILVYLSKKFPKHKWINDFLMAVCMIVGMIVACLLF